MWNYGPAGGFVCGQCGDWRKLIAYWNCQRRQKVEAWGEQDGEISEGFWPDR